jgi:xanthine dehydrogenase accessory factor
LLSLHIAQAARRCLESGQEGVTVRLESVRGSAPRAADTTMLVTQDSFVGTIGGGHLEWEAIRRARELLLGGQLASAPYQQRYALGPALGQCCGGAVVLEFALLSAERVALLETAQRPLFHLRLFGAGHVGRALVSVLAPMRCEVDWIDERDQVFPPDLPPHIRSCSVDSPEGEVDQAASGDFYVVMTHRHDLDLHIVERIVRRGDAGFVGLIGSRTKSVRFKTQLQAKGLSMERVQCPIAPDAIAGQMLEAVRKEPGVIALAIAHELLLVSQRYSPR